MDKGNELAQFLDNKNKSAKRSGDKRNSKGIKGSYAKIASLAKKWGYKIIKIALFSFFVYKVERQFSLMRNHIAKNGGLRKQGYGAFRPY